MEEYLYLLSPVLIKVLWSTLPYEIAFLLQSDEICSIKIAMTIRFKIIEFELVILFNDLFVI